MNNNLWNSPLTSFKYSTQIFLVFSFQFCPDFQMRSGLMI